MPIKYSLLENHLTADPTDYAAHVQISGSADLDAIADRMLSQGSTTTKADILAVLTDAIIAAEGYITDGYRVNFGGLAQFYPRINGVFTGPDDKFDKTRHKIEVGTTSGAELRKTVREKATPEKVMKVTPAPVPVDFADLHTANHNNLITPGNIGTITGYKLSFNEGNADEGIFFIPTGGGAAIKGAIVQKNKPSQLVILNPALAAGDYNLEVRARIYGGNDLRIGRLDAVLTV